MSAIRNDTIGSKYLVLASLCWISLVVLALSAVALIERASILTELDSRTATLHATASQRADQHDAHLTSLSAVALAEDDQGRGLFLEVGTTIMRFYPRIRGVYLVPLADREESTSAGPELSTFWDDIAEAALRSTGKPVLIAPDAVGQQYLMVKRSPNNADARYAIALLIDLESLIATDDLYWSKPENHRKLSLGNTGADGTSEAPSRTARTTFYLSSATQPLELTTTTEIGLKTLLPLGRILVVTILLTLGLVLWRQHLQARLAVRRAALSDHETRLTHAGRVNALGEMASGIAHELTQPLTAILAETQAARRLMDNNKPDRARPVLDDIVQQTQRASAILERLRAWTKPNASQVGIIDLRDSVINVRSLLENQTTPVNVALEFDLPADPVFVSVDAVEMEQVLFNLIQNAFDATEMQSGAQRVTISLERLEMHGRISVEDTGPGVDPEFRQNVFTPFVTTRDDGTGLGLALSQRLVERAGGEITLVDTATGAKFVIQLPLARSAEGVTE